MTAITSALSKVNVEETKFGSSISEYTTTKIGAAINYLIDNAIEPIGTVLPSYLTEAQFQSIKGNKWVRIAGQSIAGSDLATLTGITTLASGVANGAFLGQALVEGNINTYEASQNKSHFHHAWANENADTSVITTLSATNYAAKENTNSAPSTEGYEMAGTNTVASVGKTSNEGGADARPNTIRVNFFIKINNDNTP